MFPFMENLFFIRLRSTHLITIAVVVVIKNSAWSSKNSDIEFIIFLVKVKKKERVFSPLFFYMSLLA